MFNESITRRDVIGAAGAVGIVAITRTSGIAPLGLEQDRKARGIVRQLAFIKTADCVQALLRTGRGTQWVATTEILQMQTILELALMLEKEIEFGFVHAGPERRLTSVRLQVQASNLPGHILELAFDRQSRMYSAMIATDGAPIVVKTPDARAAGILVTSVREGLAVQDLEFDPATREIMHVRIERPTRAHATQLRAAHPAAPDDSSASDASQAEIAH